MSVLIHATPLIIGIFMMFYIYIECFSLAE